MKAHVARKTVSGKVRYYVVAELGDQPAQRCESCNKRTWIEEARHPSCSACGGSLRETKERRQKWVGGFGRKKDADAKRTEILGQLATASFVEPHKLTLGEFFDEWIAGLHRKATTLDSYRRYFNRYVRRRIGHLPLQQVNATILQRLYTELLREGGKAGNPLSPTTVAHVHALLFKILGDAEKSDLVTRNPAARVPDKPKMLKPREREYVTWRRDELRRFLAAIEGHELEALWVLLVRTGARRGEAVGAKWDDIDLDSGRWRVRRAITVVNGSPHIDTPKTAKGFRTVKLDEKTVASLRRHRARQAEDKLALGAAYADDGWVFAHGDGRHLHPNVVTRLFQRLAVRSGLPRIRLHDVRHSAVTAMLNAGVHVKAVSERVGHSSTTFTMDQYGRVIEEMEDQAAEQYAAALDV